MEVWGFNIIEILLYTCGICFCAGLIFGLGYTCGRTRIQSQVFVAFIEWVRGLSPYELRKWQEENDKDRLRIWQEENDKDREEIEKRTM
jgi:uncharacterized membrane protein